MTVSFLLEEEQESFRNNYPEELAEAQRQREREERRERTMQEREQEKPQRSEKRKQEKVVCVRDIPRLQVY